MEQTIDLAAFSGADFDKGAPGWKIALWYMVNALVVRAAWNPFGGLKRALLRAFGAQIGRGVVIKNEVRVKFPWKLVVGDYCWLGEKVWIDNIDWVRIGSNVCVSQGALLLTGNHDYTRSDMPYRNAPITIGDGAWIGAQATVCPGVTMGEGAVVGATASVVKDVAPWTVVGGNPARVIKERVLRSEI